jgi:hypothetical protein
MNGRLVSASLLLLMVWTAAPVARGQAPDAAPPGPPRGELQREMRKFFADRLRADLNLSDDQVAQILPQLQRLERERGGVRREREETLDQLREGAEGGATDEELQALLDRLDRVEREQLELKRSAYSEIDQELTVRQRVRLRFFVEGFPRMMREKIMEIRGEPRQGWERGSPGSRRPPGQRP